jgi:hypothetical protein
MRPFQTFSLVPLTLSLTIACGDKDADGDSGAVGDEVVDDDGDGTPADYDCDDADASSYPGAPEVCDGVDNDCNGIIDNDPTDGTTWYADADEDGFGGGTFSVVSCDQPSGTVDNSDDCDDLQASVNPSAEEVCDGVDQDCDTEIDEDATDPATWYADTDTDGYGDANVSEDACDAPDGYVDNADDCNDADTAVNPDTMWYSDVDGDGFGSDTFTTTGCEQPSGYVGNDIDCDDIDGAVNPEAGEYCDGIDNNCDSAIDEDTALDAGTWYTDSDGDGFGDEATARVACEPASSEIDVADDCDDGEITFYPGAPEICGDSLDQDCSGRADNTCQESVDLADLVAYVEGENAYDSVGRSLAVGDFNGDGTDDLLAGADGHDYGPDGYISSRGEAFVLYGPMSGTWSDASFADIRVAGENSSDNSGYSVATLADQDGDGADELLIGARGYDNSGGYSNGAAFVVYGGVSGAMTTADADAMVIGSASYDYLSQYFMEGSGDLNGDGTNDLVVGAHGNSTSAGAVYTFFGPLSGTMTVASADVTVAGSANYDYVGYGGVSGYDFNGDGTDDLGVGFSGSDEAGVWYGPLSAGTSVSGSTSADWIGYGASSGDFYGSRMSGGDFDGDGYDDVVVGAKYVGTTASNAGAIYVYSGSGAGLDQTESLTMSGEFSYDYIGHNYSALTSADVDGDGNDDLLFGVTGDDVYGAGNSAGAMHVVYGPMRGSLTTSQTDRVVGGAASYDYLGSAIAITDADSDGQDDLWVGAYSTTYGSAYLFLGSDLD